jgi:protease-4
MNRTLTIALIVVGAVVGVVFIGLFITLMVLGSRGGVTDGKPWSKGLGYLEIGGTIVDATDAVDDLKELESNPMVKGILIRVDSPGGVVTPSHEIYSEIRRIRDEGTPIIVSMGSIAASGGYYISAPADLIVASPQTLTGSIGVIMEFPQFVGAMEKLGVGIEVVKSAEHKDIGSPFRKMTDSDRMLLQSVVTDAYEQFVQIVSTEREIPEDSVREFADGRIMTGRQALELGLVDTLGTFEDAKRIAADYCDIKGEPRLIKPAHKLRFWVRQLFEETTDRLFGGLRFPRLRYVYY